MINNPTALISISPHRYAPPNIQVHRDGDDISIAISGPDGSNSITMSESEADMLGHALVIGKSEHNIPALGTPMADGFFGGVGGDGTWIIVSPKAEGETVQAWKTTNTDSPGARSLYDGLSNTRAIANAYHPAAAFCADLRIGGHNDWHLGSPDDMLILARNLMPRAGGNPEQTMAESFKNGGSEAFAEESYWTSAEQSSGYAWLQHFCFGGQYHDYEGLSYRVRAVRKVLPFTL